MEINSGASTNSITSKQNKYGLIKNTFYTTGRKHVTYFFKRTGLLMKCFLQASLFNTANELVNKKRAFSGSHSQEAFQSGTHVANFISSREKELI
jgi:hypothetical protein